MKTPLFKLFILAALAAQPLMSQTTTTVDHIVKKANEAAYYAGSDGRAEVTMTIEDGKGGVRERAFTILRLNTQKGDQMFYVYFKEPSDVRKMAYLVWKHVDGDDDRWLWLPDLNLVKRIAPGDKRTSFVGSDFVYEDVSGRGLDEDEHHLVEETERSYLLKNVPNNPQTVDFSHYLLTIDKKTWLPMKAEYFDKNGKLYRRVEAMDVQEVDGHPTVMKSVVSDLRTGGRTVNVFSNISYDLGLNERIFTERFLRRPPREVR